MQLSCFKASYVPILDDLNLKWLTHKNLKGAYNPDNKSLLFIDKEVVFL